MPSYFEILELPEKLSIDLADLERRFYAQSRKLHPDRFARAGEQEKQQALDLSALLNDAYRTLRNPVARAEYVLSLHGLSGTGQPSKNVPPELLEEVFELNMALEEIKMGDTDSLPSLRQADAKFRGLLDQIDGDMQTAFTAWDATGDFGPLRALLDRRKYIQNLVTETDRVLSAHVSN